MKKSDDDRSKIQSKHFKIMTTDGLWKQLDTPPAWKVNSKVGASILDVVGQEDKIN